VPNLPAVPVTLTSANLVVIRDRTTMASLALSKRARRESKSALPAETPRCWFSPGSRTTTTCVPSTEAYAGWARVAASTHATATVASATAACVCFTKASSVEPARPREESRPSPREIAKHTRGRLLDTKPELTGRPSLETPSPVGETRAAGDAQLAMPNRTPTEDGDARRRTGGAPRDQTLGRQMQSRNVFGESAFCHSKDGYFSDYHRFEVFNRRVELLL
jgi:hypothetical protein